MSYSATQIWTVILLLGLGTFLLRMSFLGLTGGRSIPAPLLRLLRYTPVAVLPGLIAPLVLWPAATNGDPDPTRLAAAGAALLAGVLGRNVLLAMLAGAGTLALGLWLQQG